MQDTTMETAERPPIELWSFGYKYGAMEANLVTDVRFMSNPYYISSLRNMTGKDEACAAYVFKDASSIEFTLALTELIVKMERSSFCREKKPIKVAIGCTGGQHRSVAVVEAVAKALSSLGLESEVHHKELSSPDSGTQRPK